MSTSAPSQDERLRRPATLRSLRLGETTVTYLPDGVAQLIPRRWLPDTTDEVWAAHPEYLDATGHLAAGVGGLLVERDGRALLIDAGLGPLAPAADPDRPVGTLHGGALLDSLAAHGRTPADIEAVAFTHLHSDHIGWAWHPAPDSDRPAFAHADYLVTEPEWHHRHLLEAHGIDDRMLSALAPRVRTVADGEEVFPGVRVRFLTGHTAGHAVYVISSGGQRLIAFGDALHSPIQVDHPEWSAAVDHDPALAADARRHLLAELREPDTLGFGIHFADVVFGRVGPAGDGPAWRPLDD